MADRIKQCRETQTAKIAPKLAAEKAALEAVRDGLTDSVKQVELVLADK